MDLFSSFSFFPTFFAQSIFDRDKQQKAHKTQKLVKPEIYCVSKSLSNFKASLTNEQGSMDFTKRISKRSSVRKVRDGCYNYRFKLYK